MGKALDFPKMVPFSACGWWPSCFASFLIRAGRHRRAHLPQVEQTLEPRDFIDKPAADKRPRDHRRGPQGPPLRPTRRWTRPAQLNAQRADAASARETFFDNWLATRRRPNCRHRT